jgi:hypothetical protein
MFNIFFIKFKLIFYRYKHYVIISQCFQLFLYLYFLCNQ